VRSRSLLYFAYGSNMSTRRLHERVATAIPLGAAHVEGWEMRFGKRSVDGSGKCTLMKSPGAVAHGVLFEIPVAERGQLDETEGPGYRTTEVLAQLNGSTLSSFSYVVNAGWFDAALRPYGWYLDLVVAGAREHGLPERYVSRLSRVAAHDDPDEARTAHHRRLLAPL
jgi:hypothetical protein